MERLDHKDLHSLIKALDTLHSDEDTTRLPERVIKILSDLIPSDTAGVDIFDLSGKYDYLSWRNVKFDFTPERLEYIEKYHHENPLYVETIINRRPDVLLLSDFVSAKEFRRTSIYKYIYSLLKADHQMTVALPISEDFTMACLLTRTGHDFTERDRVMLQFLAPHLVNAISKNFVFERLNSLLESEVGGMIVISRSGMSHVVNKPGRELLKRYFSDWGKNEGRLPRAISAWVDSQVARSDTRNMPRNPEMFEAESESGRLLVRLIYNETTGERTLLLDEKKILSPKLLESLLLTKREAEILYWLAQGKSDSEIAILCAISTRTVSKHLEHIYSKLGVENRHAAILRALEEAA